MKTLGLNESSRRPRMRRRPVDQNPAPPSENKLIPRERDMFIEMVTTRGQLRCEGEHA
jgi:hypothetical protein